MANQEKMPLPSGSCARTFLGLDKGSGSQLGWKAVVAREAFLPRTLSHQLPAMPRCPLRSYSFFMDYNQEPPRLVSMLVTGQRHRGA